jgi:hypothetical protein
MADCGAIDYDGSDIRSRDSLPFRKRISTQYTTKLMPNPTNHV